jgi:hypothetical protein
MIFLIPTTTRKRKKLKNLRTLYIRREKGKTPPYSIAGEKFIDMKKRNLLLRLWLA